MIYNHKEFVLEIDVLTGSELRFALLSVGELEEICLSFLCRPILHA